jgi:hypothetical protein
MIEICLFFYLKIRNFVREKEVYLEKECASLEGEKSLERELCLRKGVWCQWRQKKISRKGKCVCGKECGVKGGRKNL